MSYHPVILTPPLSVIGMVGAVGKIHFTPSNGICDATSAQPCPVSPRPCRKMHAAVALPPSGASTTIGFGYFADMSIALFAADANGDDAKTVRRHGSASERRDAR